MRYPLLAFGALLAAACSKPPVPTPVVTLPETADTLLIPMRSISYAVGLSGNRWVMIGLPLDRDDNDLMMVDFAAKQIGPFPGMTRAEVSKPLVVFGRGDTIVVGDWALARFTRWTPGQPRLDAIPAPAALRNILPRASDAAGNWYFQVAPVAGSGGSGNRDSTAIVRSDPLLTRFDTLARLAPPSLAEIEDGFGRAWVPRALGGEDRWGVLSDGTLWVARIFQNRIDWYAPGGAKPVRGKGLPDPVLTISDMDKEIYIRNYPPDQQESARQATQWSPVKPPFERAYSMADGKLWLFKSAPALDSVRKFQVVDHTTGVLLIVAVPSRGIAVSVTPEAIIMGENYPAGIRLLRYAMPKEVGVLR